MKRETTIAFYERGEGPKAELLMARVGDTISVKNTNVSSYQRSVMLADLANRVVARGGEKLRSNLPADAGLAIGRRHSHAQRIGPHGDDRHGIRPRGRAEVCHQLRGRLLRADPRRGGRRLRFRDRAPGTWALVRRRLRPCISQQQDADDSRSYGYLVEWWDRDATDADDPDEADDPGWTKVREGFQVLEHEAGVYFSEPPDDSGNWSKRTAWKSHRKGLTIRGCICGSPPRSPRMSGWKRSPRGPARECKRRDTDAVSRPGRSIRVPRSTKTACCMTSRIPTKSTIRSGCRPMLKRSATWSRRRTCRARL